jgi:hypothetical protein
MVIRPDQGVDCDPEYTPNSDRPVYFNTHLPVLYKLTGFKLVAPSISMKTKILHKTFIIILLTAVVIQLSMSKAVSQGRVIINEFMPWPANSCGAGSEYVELLNMGPGPMNVGGYILTDGDYAVTIPYNTIIQPNQFYVISGVNVLTGTCGNWTNANVTVNLNWNTCNCTSGTIPTADPGWFTDGGSAQEQVVLLSPTLKVVDAVVRKLPQESSSFITTSNSAGFAPLTFNLDLMTISYEVIGESAGRGNSFARRIDGSCGWLKDTQQSAGSTNNTPGDTYDLSYSTVTLLDPGCETGSAIITLNTSPAATYFPIDYILGFDANKDGMFTAADTYTTGIDSSAPIINLSNLPVGKYVINLQPVQGCNTQNITFYIGPCNLLAFHYQGLKAIRSGNGYRITASISGADQLDHIILYGGKDGKHFEQVDSITFLRRNDLQSIYYMGDAVRYRFFKLVLVDKNGQGENSEVVSLPDGPSLMRQGMLAYPNPVSNDLHVEFQGLTTEKAILKVTNSSGSEVKNLNLNAHPGQNQLLLSMSDLKPGMYYICIQNLVSGIRTETRVIKE